MAESIENSPSSIDDEEEEENLDKLNKFVSTLDRFNTVIPETVAKYYMQQCALQTDDDRVVKLLSVSVQKFMSEIINDCFQLQKLREKSTNRPGTILQSTAPTDAGITNPDQTGNPTTTKKPTSTNNTLTLNDLTHVLDEYGINVKKTFYYT